MPRRPRTGAVRVIACVALGRRRAAVYVHLYAIDATRAASSLAWVVLAAAACSPVRRYWSTEQLVLIAGLDATSCLHRFVRGDRCGLVGSIALSLLLLKMLP